MGRKRSIWRHRDGRWKAPAYVALLGSIVAVAIVVVGVALALGPRGPQVDYAAGYTPKPMPTREAAPVAVFIGDSYTQGAGAEPADERWTSRVASARGWTEVNLGRGGTGFVAVAEPAACGLDACPAYPDMIAEAVAANPSVVFIAGGQNDFTEFQRSPDTVRAAVEATYRAVRDALPDVRIVAVGPSTPGNVTPLVQRYDAMIQEVAAANGAEYVSLLDPNVIDPANVLPDGAHVNNAGHAAIGQRVIDALG